MLTRIKVAHYRSLGNIELSLTPVTVLVGRNGSGKSNLIDTLRFLKDSLTHGVDHAITDRGGIKSVRQYSPTKPYKVSFQYDFLVQPYTARSRRQQKSTTDEYQATYQLDVSSRKGGTFVVDREYAQWPESFPVATKEGDLVEEVDVFSFTRSTNGEVELTGPDSALRFAPVRDLRFPVDQLALGSIPFLFGEALTREIESLRFAQIYPNVLRDPQRPDIERALRENCSNWASVLRQLQKSPRGRKTIERIVELTRVALPDLVTIRVQSVGNFIIPYFVFRDVSTKREFSLEPSQLSDGTLRVFAILLALYQAPAGGLIAIEEPEQTIHPGLLRVIVDAVYERAREVHVVLTTHSPELIELFDVDEIRVTEMTDLGTMVGNVDKNQRESIRERLMSAAEIMALDGFNIE